MIKTVTRNLCVLAALDLELIDSVIDKFQSAKALMVEMNPGASDIRLSVEREGQDVWLALSVSVPVSEREQAEYAAKMKLRQAEHEAKIKARHEEIDRKMLAKLKAKYE